MTDASDIYRTTKLVIDRHGEDASLYAAARTAVLAGAGDEEGAAIRCQITAVVEELQRERRSDEAVNRWNGGCLTKATNTKPRYS
jgi:hypothetical protein